MSYSSLLTYGDFIPLKVTCNVNKLFEEIQDFSFQKYNPRKPHINRNGLSITSLDGELGGIDLDSMKEYNIENYTDYVEHCFRTPTQVYHKSSQIRKLIEPFKGIFLGHTYYIYQRVVIFLLTEIDHVTEMTKMLLEF